jgi:hypothetical protein
MMDVGDQFRLSVNNVAKNATDGAVSISLLRPGRASEKIAAFETYEGWVSRSK